MTPAYLGARDAAAYLGLTLRAFYNLLHRRRKAGFPITTHRLNGLLRFKPADLDAALTVEKARRPLRGVA